jgi:hypothetical protein
MADKPAQTLVNCLTLTDDSAMMLPTTDITWTTDPTRVTPKVDKSSPSLTRDLTLKLDAILQFPVVEMFLPTLQKDLTDIDEPPVTCGITEHDFAMLTLPRIDKDDERLMMSYVESW